MTSPSVEKTQKMFWTPIDNLMTVVRFIFTFIFFNQKKIIYIDITHDPMTSFYEFVTHKRIEIGIFYLQSLYVTFILYCFFSDNTKNNRGFLWLTTVKKR